MENLLQVQELSISFFTPGSEVRAVNGVSFALAAGEALGIVGESGSGKSVLASAIPGLIPAPGRVTGGSVRFGGRDMLALSEKQLRSIRGREIATVFQDTMTSLNPVFTVGNQLAETISRHTGKRGKQAKELAVALLERVGINEPERRMRQYPHELSGGMRQRVMIAMALCCEPALLIADEPTTALDVTISAQILDLIKTLRKETNTAVILITHDLGIVAEACDRVIVMYGGRVMEQGSVDDIFYATAHPYTRGLLRCVPGGAGKQLTPIPGSPPDALLLPEGCPFAPRCESCMKICLEKKPPIFEAGPEHGSACWLMEAGGGK